MRTNLRLRVMLACATGTHTWPHRLPLNALYMIIRCRLVFADIFWNVVQNHRGTILQIRISMSQLVQHSDSGMMY